MTRNPCHGWANGDPVSYLKSDGTVIAVGKVDIFKSHAGRWICKVKLQTAGTGLGRYGESVWPEGWIWGQGRYRSRCVECRQAYATNDLNEATEEFCPPCIRREQKSRDKAGSAIRNHIAYAIGSRDPRPDRRPHTAEELAAIAEQKNSDKKESPFG